MAEENETPDESDAKAEAPAEEPVAEAAAEPEVAAEPEPEAEAELEPEVATEADEAPVAQAAPAEPAADEPAAQPGPKPKKKRLPRSQRPQRTKKTPVKPATRKPIVRLEKPEHDRGRRQERQGTVVSNAMDKTIVVKVDVLKAHPKYKKVVRRSTTLHAHDESNEANVGDVVRIVETRPLSKTKRWRLAEIVEAAR
jgi:small subunit ribosomal protein S17